MKTENNREWVNYYYYGTRVDKDDAAIGVVEKIDDDYSFLIESIEPSSTIKPYKTNRKSISLIKDGKRLAAAYVQMFYQTKGSKFTKDNYILGFDQNDQETHRRSMTILDKIPTGTSTSPIAYLSGLEIEFSQENKNELLELFLKEIFKYFANKIRTDISIALIDFDIELISEDKAQSYAENLKTLAISNSIEFSCFGTHMESSQFANNRVVKLNF